MRNGRRIVPLFCALLALYCLNPWDFIGTFKPSKSSFGSAFGSLLEIQIGTDLIIAKICAFANAEREVFAERLQVY